MADYLSKKILDGGREADVVQLIKLFNTAKLYNLALIVAKKYTKIFPRSIKLGVEYARILLNVQRFRRCSCVCKSLLEYPLSVEYHTDILSIKKKADSYLTNQYISYSSSRVEDVVREIAIRGEGDTSLITISITSCKRYSLFTQTINSFIACCTDLHLVKQWICVDDNSSEEDRVKMCKLYPFIMFYMKTPQDKGHPQSMNFIATLVDTPYLFHLEDDWSFIEKRPYLTECLDVLNSNTKLGQCLINKNYTETHTPELVGGELHTTDSGQRYYIHEFVQTEEQRVKWENKHVVPLRKEGEGVDFSHCNYWPHFSFRPSLIRMSVIREVGKFNTSVSHFERDYAIRYIKLGYMSAFLEGIYCVHTGRLTSEIDDPTKLNAYKLNKEAQFSDKEQQQKVPLSVANVDPVANIGPVANVGQQPVIKIDIEVVVVNLDRRPDRLVRMTEALNAFRIPFRKFSAVDGLKLKGTAQLQTIFDNNDYNMRRGMVGCAMSHIQLWIEFINTNKDRLLCVLEDDLELLPRFQEKLGVVAGAFIQQKGDLVYLGHHPRKEFDSPSLYEDNLPVLERWKSIKSLTHSLGGTGGYIITRQGAIKMLEFINKTGMTNGIDTVQQKAADTVEVYYTIPHLYKSECFRAGENKPDTDIQYDYTSLTQPITSRIKTELDYFSKVNKSVKKIESQEDFMSVCNGVFPDNIEVVYWEENVRNPTIIPRIISGEIVCKYFWYVIGAGVVFITLTKDSTRYYHRFNKGVDEMYSVKEAIEYR